MNYSIITSKSSIDVIKRLHELANDADRENNAAMAQSLRTTANQIALKPSMPSGPNSSETLSYTEWLIQQKINELRGELETASLNHYHKEITHIKRLLRSLLQYQAALRPEDPVPEKSVFISYCTRTGSRHYEVAKKIAVHHNYRVLDGYEHQEHQRILEAVVPLIYSADVFLGIMTPAYSIANPQNPYAHKFAPSGWVMTELGMALSLGKTVRILRDESIDEDFVKPTSGDIYNIFVEMRFEQEAEIAFRALDLAYIKLLKSSIDR